MDIEIPITIKTHDSAKQLFGGSADTETKQVIVLHIDDAIREKLFALLKG